MLVASGMTAAQLALFLLLVIYTASQTFPLTATSELGTGELAGQCVA
jgi:hypothetical protein